MNRENFVELMSILKNDLVFFNNSNRFQTFIFQQFFVIFYKFNHNDIEYDFKNFVNL